MIKILKIEKDFNLRLDKFLKINYTSLTQSFIEKNIRKKNILVNNSKTLSKYLLKKDDKIKILNFHPEKFKNKIVFKKKSKISEITLNKFKKSIIFENNNFIILNKWSSIATQGGSKINISIDDIIKHLCEDYKLVHRLDKETSGLLIIAKNLRTAKIFGELFKSKSIEKTYLAICEGSPKLKESNVNLDIRNKNSKLEITKTYYKVLNNSNNLSLILFKPLTGKTHQLRIVSKNIGCPIVGDSKYNNQSKYNREKLKLNAFKLNFLFNNKKFDFFSKIPIDFNIFIKKNKFKDLKKILNIKF